MDRPVDDTTAPLSAAQHLDRIDYTEACALWATFDHWRLDDALDLLLGVRPAVCGEQGLSGEQAARRALLRELALGCLGDSLPAAAFPDAVGGYRVTPRDVIRWAEAHNLTPPTALRTALEDARAHPAKGEFDPLPAPARRRERARAIAAMLWAGDPTLTIEAMCQHPAVREFGCEGVSRSPKTVRNWIKDLAPNRQPGKRRRPQ